VTGATIDVQRPPAGWSHLRGPLLHVLVALTPADARYAPSSEAASGGDLDDVLDVLASEGMRRTPAFVAVAGASRPRVVTHADGYAVLTSVRGTLEVRAHHARVWTDLVADEDVDTVALRVSPTSTSRPEPESPARKNSDMSGSLHDVSAEADNNSDMSDSSRELTPETEPAAEPETAPEPQPAAESQPEPEPEAELFRPPSRAPEVEPPPTGDADLIAAVPWRQPSDPSKGQLWSESRAESDQSWPLGGGNRDQESPNQTPNQTPNRIPSRDPGDPDRTVDRAALLAANPAQTGAPSGPTVLAVLCTRGHLNPPTSPTCRICGREVPPQQAYETPRPALGVLRLSTGDVVSLDRGVIMGRAPQAPPGLPPELQPHVVRIASPQRDLSRNHVQVVVEGWQVILRDLDTTNGTTVTPPEGTPTRLRAGDPMVLEPGSVVSMADEVSFTYEVPSEAQQ
jgi:hypothetical protein